MLVLFFFFFYDAPLTDIYTSLLTLSQHAALPICSSALPTGAFRARYMVELLTAMVLCMAPFRAPLIGAGPDLLGRVLIWGLFGLGFDLLFGYAGILTFGQAAFYGTGSFVTDYLFTTGKIGRAHV